LAAAQKSRGHCNPGRHRRRVGRRATRRLATGSTSRGAGGAVPERLGGMAADRHQRRAPCSGLAPFPKPSAACCWLNRHCEPRPRKMRPEAAKKVAEAEEDNWRRPGWTGPCRPAPSSKRRTLPSYPETSSGRRLALARWIASRDNPLAARVAMNHIWLRHFGQAPCAQHLRLWPQRQTAIASRSSRLARRRIHGCRAGA